MPDLPGMPSTIRCASCGFENLTTSLYCQDCGARLVAPPSAIVEESAGAATAASAAPSKPARILSVDRPRTALKIFLVTVRTLVIAAFLAFIASVLLPPSSLPPKVPALSTQVIQNVRTALQRSAQTRKPLAVPWGADGLNAYIAGVLAHAAASDTFIPLTGAHVAPAAADRFTLFVQRSILGFPFHTSTTYQLVTRGNGIHIVIASATIGRLPLPAWLAPSIGLADDAVARAFTSELQILRNARTVRTTPEKVFVNFGAAYQ